MVSSSEVLEVFDRLFGDTVRFKVVEMLSKREGAGQREIARSVGITHKNLAKYLDELMEKGIIEAFPAGPTVRVYRLARRYSFLRDIFE